MILLAFKIKASASWSQWFAFFRFDFEVPTLPTLLMSPVTQLPNPLQDSAATRSDVCYIPSLWLGCESCTDACTLCSLSLKPPVRLYFCYQIVTSRCDIFISVPQKKCSMYRVNTTMQKEFCSVLYHSHNCYTDEVYFKKGKACFRYILKSLKISVWKSFGGWNRSVRKSTWANPLKFQLSVNMDAEFVIKSVGDCDVILD